MTEPASLEARLAALPRKVSVPLNQLLKVGQLSEEVIGVVLDAGERAGECATLLGFAIGFLHLRSRGVPVAEVIRMARAQGRRIRLDWSAKRWEQEHNRLARAETLKRLGDVNVRYDVAAYAACLPPGFRGYLISSSRRLGMEGLRQRHCVASYHAEILAGYSAIAVAFVERERWTVQLALTGKADRPFRVKQLRGRLNKVPPASVRNTIYAQLGLGTSPPAEDDGNVRRASYLAVLRQLLPVLREREVCHVTVSFDGSGDSGSIDAISYGDAKLDGAMVHVEIEVNVRTQEEGRWVHAREPREMDLNSAIEELTHNYLEETGVDWYNNDGGFGQLSIDVEAGTVSLEVSVRYTESSLEFAKTLDIVSGEEV